MRIDDFATFTKTGLPEFSKEQWSNVNNLFTKTEVKEWLADYIHSNNIPFPFREITIETVEEKFKKLSKSNIADFILPIKDKKIISRHKYRYDWEKHTMLIINNGHYYNDISNFFQQKNRLDCGSTTTPSPLEIWNDKHLLSKMNWTFWRHGITGGEVKETNYRGAFRLGTYTATQFKPHVAKVMYDLFEADIVLDQSSGWGDRLAGFWTSKAKKYVGVDPNRTLHSTYLDQNLDYTRLSTDHKFANMIPDCFEDRVKIWASRACFDFAFTSPPYFSTEMYASGTSYANDQSWFKYPTFNSWKNDFLFRGMIEPTWNKLTNNGIMAMNIIDPFIGNKRYEVCDDMVDFVVNELGGSFLGIVGMRMMQRPKKMDSLNKVEYFSSISIEPIYIFSRNKNYSIKDYKESTLDEILLESIDGKL